MDIGIDIAMDKDIDILHIFIYLLPSFSRWENPLRKGQCPA